MAIVPTETVVGTATLIAEATRVSRASGVTTGAVEKESVTVSGVWRVTPAALV
jgi:hypothetical protein